MVNTVLILTSVAAVQLIIDKVDAVSRDYGLEMSAENTKIMVVAVRVTCSGVLLEMLDTFCYVEFKTWLGITATAEYLFPVSSVLYCCLHLPPAVCEIRRKRYVQNHFNSLLSIKLQVVGHLGSIAFFCYVVTMHDYRRQKLNCICNNDNGQVCAGDVECLCVWLAEKVHYHNLCHYCFGNSSTYNWPSIWLILRLDPWAMPVHGMQVLES